LLGDLLTMAQSDSDRLDIHLSSLDAHTSLSSAKAAVQSQAAQAMVDVRLPLGAANVRVLADERRLHQCLVNLLSNAIKYNHPQGSVELQLSVDGGQVHLDVCDSGQGMTAEQLKQLFQPFNRLGRERQRTPGTGLGLVITQQLVHAMGGSLHVKSSTHQGSCFTITLPCAAAPVSP
jgi:signal transduction histidine kinase